VFRHLALPDLALAADGPNRVAERRRDPDWLSAVWADPRTRVLHVVDSRICADESGTTPLVHEPVLSAFSNERELIRVLLGEINGVVWFAELGEPPPRFSSNSHWVHARSLLPLLDEPTASLVAQAVGLEAWHAGHTHCPRCGQPTLVDEAGHVRRCPADGSLHYPRTDPAIIVLVTDEADRALLGRQGTWPEGRFSTLAGFVEPGESAEAAVSREVFEEAGVELGDVRYLASQPWPFPASLMLGFEADARTTEIEVDGTELAEARWFSREELRAAIESGEVLMPPGISISRRLIERWFGG
jgi:NAD+ diphosphatase